MSRPIRGVPAPLLLRDIGSVQEDHEAAKLAFCTRSVEEDRADAIILAGTPLTGLGCRLAGHLPVPLFDAVSSGLRLAQARVRGDRGSPDSGDYLPPLKKPYKGLPSTPDALSGRLMAD